MNTTFDGLLDDFSIWNTSLTEQEIQNYTNCPPNGNGVGYWNFEEGPGSRSHNGNDGIINVYMMVMFLLNHVL